MVFKFLGSVFGFAAVFIVVVETFLSLVAMYCDHLTRGEVGSYWNRGEYRSY